MWPGHSSASRIFLPQPEIGLQYYIMFLAQAVSSATKIGPSSGLVRDVVVNATTAAYGGHGSTAELGLLVQCIGLTDSRWLLSPMRASTIAYSAVSSGYVTYGVFRVGIYDRRRDHSFLQ